MKICFTEYASKIQLLDSSKLALNQKNDKDQFVSMTSSSIFFDVALFPLSNLVTGPSFMSVSLLILELSQFSL